MFHSILVPLDGSEFAEQALPYAAGVTPAGARITLVTVIHSVDELIGTRQPRSDVDLTEDILARAAYEEERAEGQRCLKDATAELAGKGLDIHSLLVEGAPRDEILRAAEDARADLIVMTSYGRSAVLTPTKVGVFGGVVDAVLRAAKVPVLVIKPSPGS